MTGSEAERPDQPIGPGQAANGSNPRGTASGSLIDPSSSRPSTARRSRRQEAQRGSATQSTAGGSTIDPPLGRPSTAQLSDPNASGNPSGSTPQRAAGAPIIGTPSSSPSTTRLSGNGGDNPVGGAPSSPTAQEAGPSTISLSQNLNPAVKRSALGVAVNLAAKGPNAKTTTPQSASTGSTRSQL